jgi:mono/diheme cytochrome c family protein
MRNHLATLCLVIAVTMIVEGCGVKAGDPARGERVFNARCWNCHEKDTEDYALGPGLKNYWQRSPHKEKNGSEHNHTEEFVRNFIRNGSMNMPPQKDHLTEQEVADVISYLKTL